MDLQKIYEPIDEDLVRVENRLKEQFESSDEFIPQISSYVFTVPGKRIRPALVLFSEKVVSTNNQRDESTYPQTSIGGDEKIISLAAAIELVHTATLIHDDVIDDAVLRRGRSSVNAKWGNEYSILFGDYLYSKAFSLLSRLERPDILALLSSVTNTMCEGEMAQMQKRYCWDLTEEEYLGIIERKTASLISVCCQVGAILGGANKRESHMLREYGLNLGIAFQIVDDCLDLVGKEGDLGKSLRLDVRKGKPTLPLVYLLHQTTGLQNCAESANPVSAFNDLEALWDSSSYLRKEALYYAFQKAGRFTNKAREEIGVLKESPFKESLLKLTDYVLRREQMRGFIGMSPVYG